MIALNMENGKEVAMGWIAIAVEFAKGFFKHLVKVATFVSKIFALSILIIAGFTGAGLAGVASIVASINLLQLILFIVALALMEYLEEKGVF